jgi:PIN domain nuclease of toxin-antitoxin system
MILLDTHVWVFYYSQQYKRLSKKAIETLSREPTLVISPISGWELAQLGLKKRIDLKMDVGHWIDLTLKDPRLELLDMSMDILVSSVCLEAKHKDPVDRILATTAIFNNIPLITADKKLHQFPKLKTIW